MGSRMLHQPTLVQPSHAGTDLWEAIKILGHPSTANDTIIIQYLSLMLQNHMKWFPHLLQFVYTKCLRVRTFIFYQWAVASINLPLLQPMLAQNYGSQLKSCVMSDMLKMIAWCCHSAWGFRPMWNGSHIYKRIFIRRGLVAVGSGFHQLTHSRNSCWHRFVGSQQPKSLVTLTN
jgi:hypothetical protein